MSDYLYYCGKCNSLVADGYEDDEIACDSCGARMAPLHIDEDDWDAMSNDEKMALLSKYRNPQPQVRKSRPTSSGYSGSGAGQRQKKVSNSQQYGGYSGGSEKDYYDRTSGLSIAGFILSFLGCLSIVGLILGIVDLTKKDGRKKGLSIAAVAISAVMLIASVAFAANMSGGTSKKSADNAPVVTAKEDNPSEAGRSNDTSEETQDEPAEEVKTEYKAGETWSVDGQWTLTVLGATETEERNQFSEKNPASVYIIDYMYTNMGYNDDFMDGLYFSLDDMIVDSAGSMGYSYPGDTVHGPKETPIGASCKAQSCIGVDNSGPFKITVTKYDGNGEKQSATFVVDPAAETIEADSASAVTADIPTVDTGETWTVDGQWEFTINGASPTDERNQFSEKNPAAVYIVDYTYKNIGYEDEYMDGLYFSIDDMIVDSEGAMGYSYPGDTVKSPKETPVGASCDAQACIGVDHAGDFKVTITKYDGNGDKQSETFNVRVSE